MEPTIIQSAGYKITYIAQPGENGPRVLVDKRSPIKAVKAQIIAAYGEAVFDAANAYAMANPIVVPYILEDFRILCSLINTGYTRYLLNGGTGYLDLGFVPDQTLDIEFGYYNVAEQIGGVWGASQSWSTNQAMAAYASSQIHCYYGGDMVLNLTSGLNIVKANKDVFQIGSNTRAVGGTIKNITGNLTFFKGGGRLCNAKMPYIKVMGNTEMELYPFTRNGANGMIDILSGSFFGNSGTGTLTIEEV